MESITNHMVLKLGRHFRITRKTWLGHNEWKALRTMCPEKLGYCYGIMIETWSGHSDGKN